MKKLSIFLSVAVAATATAQAQSVTDMARLSETGLSGTARYRSMGGAFGALGGDATVISDNPAGMAIYRGTSELSITPHFTYNSTTTKGSIDKDNSKSEFAIGNLAYVISFRTESSSLVNFNIGIGFNHSEGLDRKYRSYLGTPRSSFGAYLANQANNWLVHTGNYNNPNILGQESTWNTSAPLMSLMGYNSYTLDNAFDPSGNPAGVASFDQADGRHAEQWLSVNERNRTDEYNISAAANWLDMFYAGVTLSIIDLNSTVESYLDESYGKNSAGQENYTLYDNKLESKASGVNLKLGFLLKPVNAWRIGMAFHTPTWLNVKDIYSGYMETDANNGHSGTGTYEYRYKLYTPWQLQVSTAYIIGNHGLVSVEYGMKDYTFSKLKEHSRGTDQDELDIVNDVNKDYMAPQHIFKVGGEVRVTPKFSLRAGYQYRTSPYKKEVMDELQGRSWRTTNGTGNWGDDNGLLFSTSTKPNYSLLDDQHFICFGMGWKGKGWFIDLAFVDQIRNEKIAAFPTTDALIRFDDSGNAVLSSEAGDGAVTANHIDMKSNIMSWDVTFGFKF